MNSQRKIETLVGLFIIIAILGLAVLAFKVSGLTTFFKEPGYEVTANFDNVGGLKARAPVKIAGVLIGEVTSIELDPTSFKAQVKMNIKNHYNDLPSDSSASILTAGLLGDNYIEITPMYAQDMLKNGSVIEFTHPAMILEKLIGQFLFKSNGDSGSKPAASTPAEPAASLPPVSTTDPTPPPEVAKPEPAPGPVPTGE